jgi:hypothetical protein
MKNFTMETNRASKDGEFSIESKNINFSYKNRTRKKLLMKKCLNDFGGFLGENPTKIPKKSLNHHTMFCHVKLFQFILILIRNKYNPFYLR